MKSKLMPTTIVLNVFSWLVAVSGVLKVGVFVIFEAKDANAWISAVTALLGAFLLAALIRMAASIGQILFDSKVEVIRVRTAIEKSIAILEKNGAGLEQINCDSKDISQNINQIKTFFERIERHLDLKK
ncbi:MAG: hypothetical protein HZB36_05095 [Candidatus Omnitrophica bacterium]|nr:hypothetical protein [Candidatus Omnitrophota bacterium]